MAIKTNTYLTFSAKGIRENLSDVIYRISPEETPFMSNGGKEKAENVFFEWQTDALAATDTTNNWIEGDDVDSVGYQANTPTVRIGNYTQISRKSVIVSGTLDAVNKAGRKKEMAYQLAKRSAELKRDMEAICLMKQAALAGNGTTARTTASLSTYIVTNATNTQAGGANPTINVLTTARTDGTTPIAFTEAMLKANLQSVWTQGGKPEILMVDGPQKQTVSTFAGIAVNRYELKSPKPGAIIGAADVYVSDFGQVSIIPNRFQRHRDAFVLDPEYYSLAFLRPFQTTELATTGDAQKRLLLVEWGLKVKQEAALGGIYDLS